MASQVDSLSNEFNLLIKKYQDTYNKYIDVIDSDDKSLKTINNYSFFGENKLNTLTNSDVTACEKSCFNTPFCSGATFNTVTNNCILSSGTGKIVPTQQSKAIIKEAMYYSYELQKLNYKLMDINQEMMNISNSSYNEYQETQKQSNQAKEIINTNYQTLSEERNHIEKMIRDYETLNKAYENGNIVVTSNYYRYILLSLIVILLIFIFLKFYLTTSQSGGGKFIFSKYNIYNFIPFFLLILAVLYFEKNKLFINQ